MSEIIDFQSVKHARLRESAGKCAENAAHLMARAEWLRRNGSALADVIRASLDASKAEHDRHEIGRRLAAEATENLRS